MLPHNDEKRINRDALNNALTSNQNKKQDISTIFQDSYRTPNEKNIQGANCKKLEAIAKLPFFVTPAKAGVFNLLNDRDSCFRRNDKKLEKGNFAIASLF